MVLSPPPPLVAVVEVVPPSLQPPSIRGSAHQGLLAADLPVRGHWQTFARCLPCFWPSPSVPTRLP